MKKLFKVFVNANAGLGKTTGCAVTLSLSKGVRWLAHLLRQAQYDLHTHHIIFQPLACIMIALLMTSGIKSNAQNFIAAKSFVKNKTVFLRCVPNNIATLDYCKEKGFTIKRIVWESNILPDSTNFRTTPSLFFIKALNKENKKWDTLSGSSPEADFLYSILYEPGNSTDVHMNMAFGLAMLSCDFDVELANAAGLFYIDENLPIGKYAYLIQPTENKPGVKIKPAIVIVNTAINDQLKNIDSLKIKTKRKEVSLAWDAEKLKTDYTGYFIERSEDGKSFSVLNKKPHIQVQTQYEKNKKDISFNEAEGDQSVFAMQIFGMKLRKSKLRNR